MVRAAIGVHSNFRNDDGNEFFNEIYFVVSFGVGVASYAAIECGGPIGSPFLARGVV